jgi:hypothetical protein
MGEVERVTIMVTAITDGYEGLLEDVGEGALHNA